MINPKDNLIGSKAKITEVAAPLRDHYTKNDIWRTLKPKGCLFPNDTVEILKYAYGGADGNSGMVKVITTNRDEPFEGWGYAFSFVGI